jgi:hypothetical protein
MKKKLTAKQLAEKTKQYEKEILKVIKDNPDMCFIREIFCEYSGCCSSTFYEHGLEKSEHIKSALEENRTKIKKEMRGNWKKKDASPALQIGAYKLMGTEDERKKLSQTFIESSGPGGGPIKYADMTEEEIDKRIAELNNGQG